MSKLTGLGPLEEAILVTLDNLGARGERPYRKSASVLEELERQVGFGPRYAYEALCDLARPWSVVVPLVDGHGNLGTPEAPAAEARYTECRLAAAGMLAVAAERRELPALPIRFINGTLYCGGSQPAFEPRRLLASLSRLIDDPLLGDDELLDLVGPPVFPTGCRVGGEVDRLIAGHPATLKLSAVITIEHPEGGVVLEISNLPPGVGANRVESNIESRIGGHRGRYPSEVFSRTNVAVTKVQNQSGLAGSRIRCSVASDVDPETVAQHVREVWGVTIELHAALPRPLAEMVRSWIQEHAVDETPASLARLEACC